jgi:hypothetical protein
MLPRLRQRVLPTAVRERCRLARTGHLRMSERTPREYCEVPNDAQPTAGGAAGTALYSQHQPVTQSSAVLVVLLSALTTTVLGVRCCGGRGCGTRRTTSRVSLISCAVRCAPLVRTDGRTRTSEYCGVLPLLCPGGNTPQYSQYSLLLPLSTAQHSTAQHSTAQHSTAQHSTAQHSTAQHSALPRRAVPHTAGRTTARRAAATV